MSQFGLIFGLLRDRMDAAGVRDDAPVVTIRFKHPSDRSLFRRELMSDIDPMTDVTIREHTTHIAICGIKVKLEC